MWLWGTVIVVLGVFALVGIVVDRRRGAGSSSGDLDLTPLNRAGEGYDGSVEGWSSGAPGDGAGGHG